LQLIEIKFRSAINISETEPTEREEGIGIGVDGTLEYAFYKIIKGTKPTFYIPESVAKRIARALLAEKNEYELRAIPIVDDTGEELCRAEIEIMFDD